VCDDEEDLMRLHTPCHPTLTLGSGLLCSALSRCCCCCCFATLLPFAGLRDIILRNTNITEVCWGLALTQKLRMSQPCTPCDAAAMQRGAIPAVNSPVQHCTVIHITRCLLESGSTQVCLGRCLHTYTEPEALACRDLVLIQALDLVPS
jgi:hypothetical protein